MTSGWRTLLTAVGITGRDVRGAPALPDRHVGEEIVGVHGGLCDNDVAGEEERDLLHVGEDLNGRLPRRRGVARASHVQEQGVDAVGIAHAGRRDDLLVDVTRVGIPGAFGRIARKQSRLLVFALFPSQPHAEGLGLVGVKLAEVERTVLAAVFMPVATAGGETALPAGVADQDVQGHDRLAVVVAIGVLDRTSVEVDRCLLAIGG